MTSPIRRALVHQTIIVVAFAAFSFSSFGLDEKSTCVLQKQEMQLERDWKEYFAKEQWQETAEKEATARKKQLGPHIELDERRIDAVLQPLLDTLKKSAGGYARIEAVAILLQELRHIHLNTEFPSQRRRDRLEDLAKQAQQVYERYSKNQKEIKFIEKSSGRLSEMLIKIEPRIDQNVYEFVMKFFSTNLKLFESVDLRLGAGVAMGINLAVGCGSVSDLAGNRRGTLSLEPGIHWEKGLVSCIASCTVSKDISEDYDIDHYRNNDALLGGPVTQLKSLYGWTPLKEPSDPRDKDEVIGVCLGLGFQNSASTCLKIPCLPWSRSFEFPRQLLGLVHHEFLEGKRDVGKVFGG